MRSQIHLPIRMGISTKLMNICLGDYGALVVLSKQEKWWQPALLNMFASSKHTPQRPPPQACGHCPLVHFQSPPTFIHFSVTGHSIFQVSGIGHILAKDSKPA